MGGDGGAVSWGVGAVDGGFVNACLAVTLTRVMRATVPIPAVASVSVLHSATVGGSVASLRYPLSVFNKNSTLNPTLVYTVPTLPPSPTLLSLALPALFVGRGGGVGEV